MPELRRCPRIPLHGTPPGVATKATTSAAHHDLGEPRHRRVALSQKARSPALLGSGAYQGEASLGFAPLLAKGTFGFCWRRDRGRPTWAQFRQASIDTPHAPLTRQTLVQRQPRADGVYSLGAER